MSALTLVSSTKAAAGVRLDSLSKTRIDGLTVDMACEACFQVASCAGLD